MELYLNYNKKSDIHGTVLYPAPMIAPLQFDILKKVADEDNLKILDPFHGSGISIYEAAKINSTFSLYGFDINPFANLITSAKIFGVDNNIDEDILYLERLLNSDELAFEIHEFNNIDKWFNKNVIQSLSKIKYSISQISSKQNRIYFWTIFSNTIRRFSNTRSSTYKLHVKNEFQLENLIDLSIPYFINDVRNSVSFYKKKFKNRFIIKKTDTLTELKKYPGLYFDILITSPPYGDNHTTVPYGQFSSIALFWIDEKDLNLEGWELNNYSIIDRESMGGVSKKDLNFTIFQKEIIFKYIKNIKTDYKRLKVENFLYDYFIFLEESIRVAKKYIVLTLGNRTVDGVRIDLTTISKEYLELNSFVCENIIERELQNKRIPTKISNVNNKSVTSINKEYLLVMKKQYI